MRLRSVSRVLALVSALAAGCGPSSFPGPPEVTLGTGVNRFVPVVDDDPVPIIMGLQGGYHIWGSVRARYLDPKQVRLVFTLTRPDDAAPFSIRHDTIDLDGTDDGFTEGVHLGSAVFLPDVMVARGHVCRWHLDVTDGAGRHVAVERRIVPTGP